MKNKETESSFDALAKEIGNYHTDLYNRLEKLIDSDEEFVDMYKEVKELFRIRENIIKAECNLPKNISITKKEGLDPAQRYRVIKYLRNILYSGKFMCVPSDKFAILLSQVIATLRNISTQEQIKNALGFAKNKLTSIKKLGDAQTVPVSEQIRILEYLHNLCYNELNNEIEELDELREVLEELLGYNITVCSDDFYQRYFHFFEDDEQEKAELSKLTGIRPEDLQELLNDITYPYYPEKVHELTELMIERVQKKISISEIEKFDVFANERASFWSTYLDDDSAYWENEYINTYNSVRKEIGDWFLSLPDFLKGLVKELAYKQFRVADETEDSVFYFRDFVCGCNAQYYYFVADGNHQSLILKLIHIFRKLSDNEKKYVMNYLHDNMNISLPIPSERSYIGDYFSDCAVSSFFLSTLTSNESLSERYKNTSKTEKYLDTTSCFNDILDRGHSTLNYLKKAIDFTSEEWRLAGYVETAIATECSLSPIFEVLRVEPQTLDFD